MFGLKGRIKGHEIADYRQRFRLIFAIVLIAMSLLMLRLWYLQVIKGSELRQRSESNSVRLRRINPLRGMILDNGGHVLVDNQTSFDLVYIPNRPEDKKQVISKLTELYASRSWKTPDEFSSIAKAHPFMPTKIDRNISREKLALIETHSLELPGVAIEVVPIRKYVAGEMIAHIVGYVSEVSQDELERSKGARSPGDMVGKTGIERHYDAYLRGKNGAEQVEVNALGKAVRSLGRINPVAGCNLVLTIDAYLQEVAWKAMAGKSGAVVAMDPRDGSIYAMVSSPGFDPNLFNGGISTENWNMLSRDPLHPMEQRAISGQYPPGSTYKLIVAAAALEEGLISPESSILCTGSFDFGNRSYRCWQKHGHGMVNLHRAIVESCDVYFYILGKKLGVDRIAWYAKKFGFGAVTGIDLPREKAGMIPTSEWKLARFKKPWQGGETISVSIGQGFNSVTPLQLAVAYSALANGGTVYRPQIVKKIEATDGRLIKAMKPEKKETVPISRKTTALLKQGLWGVVNEPRGTGGALRRAEMDVCGKTGTAQVVGLPASEKARRAMQSARVYQDHALFTCFAPCRNPEITVAVIVEHGGHGGSVAAPIARKVIDAYYKKKKYGDKMPVEEEEKLEETSRNRSTSGEGRRGRASGNQDE
ncbi:MAG: penicillin-binding protein 2 [Syntrophus sp. (in: bacteria)]|nr:penicillin-binding protein 2 [Syntrophus sp. (in: bacteria)]